jgi:TatD DNase family protein
MGWFDTHCHLDTPPLGGRAPQVMDDARTAGVERVLAVAYDRASLASLADLRCLPGVVIAAGQHPWVAHEDLERNELADQLSRLGAVAVGEIGLDFRYDKAPSRERQIAQFTWQLELAVDLNLPVSLHVRGAFDEMLTLLKRFHPRLRGAVHAFSRGPDLARRFCALGLHIAFGGTLTQSRAHAAHEAARAVPLDRLLVETDAPAIAVQPVPAQAVEPRHVALVGQTLARLRGESVESMARATTENARELFLACRPPVVPRE